MLRTPCYNWHAAHGGRIVDFAGWQMPVQYTTITAEHQAVRTAAGLFDIAHMGRLRFRGPDAGRFLDRLVTVDVTAMQVGQVKYALVCNESGGILDDVLLYRLLDSYLLVVNASNRLKILDWIEAQSGGFDFHLADDTFTWFMLAIQGPKSLDIVNPLVQNDLSQLSYYWVEEANVIGTEGLVSRTGYTGEVGFEVMLPAEHGPRLWETLLERGAQAGLLAAGLGCRDTLRLEAAMPLYGHELSETIDPFTAGLGFAVNLEAADFVGRTALMAACERGDRPKRVGLELDGKRIAREGTTLWSGDQQVGHVTSGTFSPTLGKSIAMAYVDAEFSAKETVLAADIRGTRIAATVTKLPFYRRKPTATVAVL